VRRDFASPHFLCPISCKPKTCPNSKEKTEPNMKTLLRPLKWSCAALLAVALPAVAQTTDTWSGAVDANWSTAGN
jgi:hypothetical protein